MNKEITEVYVDGSYNKERNLGGWAFCVIENDTIIHDACGIVTDISTLEGYQIGGECKAVIKALEWASRFNRKIIIYHDLKHLFYWVSDIFGQKNWKTNQPYTKEYRRLVLIYKDYLEKFVKVKAHSGDRWNNHVDKLAGSIY